MENDRPRIAAALPTAWGADADVWWGEDGIDALIWADPTPYEAPTPEVPVGGSPATEAAL